MNYYYLVLMKLILLLFLLLNLNEKNNFAFSSSNNKNDNLAVDSAPDTDDDSDADAKRPAKRDTLYEPSDAILEPAGKLGFDFGVYRQKRAFFVEFYSSWCGHCIQFAPKFKLFAKDVQQWKNIVQITAVNCNAEENYVLCREHDIQFYPTLKYFPYGSLNVSDGIVYEGHREKAEELSAGLASMVYDDFKQNNPPNWPNLDYVDSEITKENLWRQLDSELIKKTDQHYLILVISSSSSSSLPGSDFNSSLFHASRIVGIQVALDFQDYRSQISIRSIKNDSLIVQKYYNNGQNNNNAAGVTVLVPGLIILKKKLDMPYYKSEFALTRHEIGQKILYQTSLNIVDKTEQISATTQIYPHSSIGKTDPKVKSKYFVHKLDLLSSLWYIFYREIGKYKVVEGSRLIALKQFMEVLLKYFPSNHKEKQFLFKFTSWMSSQTGQVSHEVWSRQLNATLKQTGNPLPNREKYVHCRGTKSGTRRYPCSLWTLFHTLTVQAYKIDGSTKNFVPRDVILTFRHFISEIFGCQDCAKNFDKETADLMTEVKNPQDVVLYLWRVHNSVNHRLKGDDSEDPAYPKQQFPMPELCPRCYNTGTQTWDETLTLQFLVDYYSDIRTNEPPKESVDKKIGRVNPKFAGKLKEQLSADDFYDDNQQQGDSMAASAGHTVNIGSIFSSLDVSLCLVIWFLSTFLVLYLFFYFKFRRNRHNSFHHKCFKTYFKFNTV